jgi:hypothetical protein
MLASIDLGFYSGRTPFAEQIRDKITTLAVKTMCAVMPEHLLHANASVADCLVTCRQHSSLKRCHNEEAFLIGIVFEFAVITAAWT